MPQRPGESFGIVDRSSRRDGDNHLLVPTSAFDQLSRLCLEVVDGTGASSPAVSRSGRKPAKRTQPNGREHENHRVGDSLLLVLAGALPAQEVVAVLKGEDGQGFNLRGWPVARWNGYWVHRDEGNATSLYLFHENGEFARMLGREGEGPMEFQSITDAVVVGDSLYVHDSMNARVTVIGPGPGTRARLQARGAPHGAGRHTRSTGVRRYLL